MSERAPILCLSHLAWEQTLFQRPQQIMKRMAARGHDVLYVSKISTRRWLRDLLRGRRGLHRGRDGSRLKHWNSPWLPAANHQALIRAVDERWVLGRVRRWLRGRGDEATLWLYHPDYIRYLDRIPHACLVYDVMDHFPGFTQSKANVLSLEDQLLARADVVFTGGGALQDSVVDRRPGAHCFASGVEIDHFAKAREAGTAIPDDVRALPHPILGYFGAVDERLDFDLIRAVCRARPGWSVVLLGPLIPGTALKIEGPNFHWLGPKPYAELPNYLRAFDVCLMPWVQTTLTAHISPTKTPEYLAGGKPVVSVPIRDVMRDYGDVVFFGATPEEFIAAIERALAASPRDWAATLVGREAARTWDQIAEEMDGIVDSLTG